MEQGVKGTLDFDGLRALRVDGDKAEEGIESSVYSGSTPPSTRRPGVAPFLGFPPPEVKPANWNVLFRRTDLP